MNEVRPQIVYTPQGELVVNVGLNEEPTVRSGGVRQADTIAKKRDGRVDFLTDWPGITAAREGDRLAIQVNVADAFTDIFRNGDDARVADFLEALHWILPFRPVDTIDRVLGLENIGVNGVRGVVYTRLQQWLNAGGLSEQAALHCILAMAVPFGDIAKEAKDSFHYIGGGIEAGDGWVFRVVASDARFDIRRLKGRTESKGTAQWRTLEITTLGSCACWGASTEDRASVRITPETGNRLHALSPHNIDTAHQTFSLLLGGGALAYLASQYSGSENVLTAVEWQRPQSRPQRRQLPRVL